jgi:ribosomal-protein-alanine N-acetyltransferase
MLITDTAAVAAIESQVSIEPWSEKLFADCILVGYSCWVVAIEQTVIGFGLLSCAAGEAHILNVAITSNWRQQGLGRALMQHLVQVATELNADIIYLEVRESNTIARKLYQDLAFIEIGRRKGYYPKDNNSREDAITLALSLS